MPSTKPNTKVDVEADIYRSAWNLIRNHGDRALRVATKRQEAMIAKGDTKGVTVWWHIGEAIKELRRTKRQEHEPLN